MAWLMGQKIFCVKTYYETKSFKIVQARYKRKFNFNTFLSRNQIFKLVKNFEAYGTCEDRRATGSSPCGHSITIRTPENVTRVQESFGRSPTTSLRRFSQQLGISVSSVRRILVKDLKLKAAITERIQAITQDECACVINNFARRIQQCLRLNGGHFQRVV
jgi:hypothetical protein